MSAEHVVLLAAVELTTSSALRVTENAVASTLTVIDPATGGALASTKTFYLRGDGSDDDLLQVLVETIQSHTGANTYTAALTASTDPASPSVTCTITRATGTNNFQINWTHAGTTIEPSWFGFTDADTANDGNPKSGTLSSSVAWVSPDAPQVCEEHPEYDVSVQRSRSGRVRALRRGGPYHIIDIAFTLLDSRRVLRTDNTSDPDATFMVFLETVGDGTDFEIHTPALSSGTTLEALAVHTRLRETWRFDEETSSAIRPSRDEPGMSLYSFSVRAEGQGESTAAPEVATDIIAAGTFTGNVTIQGTALTVTGTRGIWLAALDDELGANWVTKIVSTSTCYPNALAGAVGDRFVVSGSFLGTLSFHSVSGATPPTLASVSTSLDGFYACYSSAGECLWVRKVSPSTAVSKMAVCTALSMSLDGSEVVVEGLMENVDSNSFVFGAGEPGEVTRSAMPVTSTSSTFILRIDMATGNLVAAKFIDNPTDGVTSRQIDSRTLTDIRRSRDDYFPVSTSGVKAPANPDVAIIWGNGEANQTSITLSANSPDFHSFSALYNSDGTLRWAAKTTSTTEAILSAVNVTKDVLIEGGSFVGTASFFDPGAGVASATLVSSGTNIWYSGRNSAGTTLWAKKATATASTSRYLNHVLGIGVSTSGANSFLAGNFGTASTIFGPGEANETTLSPAGTRDGFVAGIASASGNLQWVKKFGGSSANVFVNQSIMFNDDAFIVMGDYDTTITLGSGEANATSLAVTSGVCGFIAHFDPATGSLTRARRMPDVSTTAASVTAACQI